MHPRPMADTSSAPSRRVSICMRVRPDGGSRNLSPPAGRLDVDRGTAEAAAGPPNKLPTERSSGAAASPLQHLRWRARIVAHLLLRDTPGSIAVRDDGGRAR